MACIHTRMQTPPARHCHWSREVSECPLMHVCRDSRQWFKKQFENNGLMPHNGSLEDFYEQLPYHGGRWHISRALRNLPRRALPTAHYRDSV